MFFWLQHGNSSKSLLNLDCRCNILLDYVFKNQVEACRKFVTEKRAEVEHSIEEIKVNRDHLAKAAENGSAPDSAEDVSLDGEVSGSAPIESSETLAKLEEILQTRRFQLEALQEAAVKLEGLTSSEIDFCDDMGHAVGLQSMKELAASDMLEDRATYNLCRKALPQSNGNVVEEPKKGSSKAKKGKNVDEEEKIIMLTFAVPPDNALNLDLLLGSGKVKVVKTRGKKKKGNHRRSNSERPPQEKSRKAKGLADITNRAGRGHARSQTRA